MKTIMIILGIAILIPASLAGVLIIMEIVLWGLCVIKYKKESQDGN